MARTFGFLGGGVWLPATLVEIIKCGLVMALGNRGQKCGVSATIGELRVVSWCLVEKYGGASPVLQRCRVMEVTAGCLLMDLH